MTRLGLAHPPKVLASLHGLRCAGPSDCSCVPTYVVGTEGERESRTSVHPEEYTGDSRVELDNLESRGGPSSVLNPLVAGRFASSRLRR